jgi:hypothetical protein
MRRQQWGPCLLVLLWLCGCASSGGLGDGDTLKVGQREGELVARKGQPQEVQLGPTGEKIYVYTTYNLDQVAAMGGGAWNKPFQEYYWLDDQGVITRVAQYPYGKRNFIFPTKEKPTVVVQAPAARRVAPAPPASPGRVKASEPQPSKETAPPSSTSKERASTLTQPAPTTVTTPAPASPRTARVSAVPSSPPRSDMEAATRLELNMSREDVRRVLGLPERTEGFQSGGRAVIVWFYLLEPQKGRTVATPLVFEEGRLRGWGDNYYRRRLREVSGQGP